VNGFNAVDVVVLIWLLVGVWRGVRHGLAGTLLRLAAVTLAVCAGTASYAWLGEKIAGPSGLSGASSHLLAFLLTTVAVYVLLRFLGMLLKNMMTFTFKGKLEAIGGGVVGLLVSATVITTLLLIMGRWPNPKIHQGVAVESWAGRTAQQQLGPLWQQLEQRYPALQVPENIGPETLETTVKEVKTDVGKAGAKAEKTAAQKAKQTKQHVNDAVVESNKQ